MSPSQIASPEVYTSIYVHTHGILLYSTTQWYTRTMHTPILEWCFTLISHHPYISGHTYTSSCCILCRTMACFHVISISLISGGDHVVHTYFYVPWLIMTSQWVMMLLGMPHCGTTMGNITRDIHYDVTMDNDIAMCT